MNVRFTLLLKLTGSALTVALIIFIGALLWRERDVLFAFKLGFGDLTLLVLCAFISAMLGYALADAWRRLLVWAGESEVCPADARRIYAQTQIAKYIPGNVAQFASRQIIGRRAGWSHMSLLLSTVAELGLLVCIAAAIAAITIGVFWTDSPIASTPFMILAVALVLTGLAALRVAPAALAKRWPMMFDRMKVLKVWELRVVAIYYVLFFFVSGILLIVVTAVVLGELPSLRHWPLLSGLFAVAWIMSTLTPGAPSGIGVRETVLVVGLAFITTTGNAALIATLLRVVTVFGDVLFTLVAGLRNSR
jgi:hypothetical protein